MPCTWLDHLTEMISAAWDAAAVWPPHHRGPCFRAAAASTRRGVEPHPPSAATKRQANSRSFLAGGGGGGGGGKGRAPTSE